MSLGTVSTDARCAQSNVQSTQEIVELILDSNRNALLALDLKISILTMGIGIGTLVAGVFGMNVRGRQIRVQLPAAAAAAGFPRPLTR